MNQSTAAVLGVLILACLAVLLAVSVTMAVVAIRGFIARHDKDPLLQKEPPRWRWCRHREWRRLENNRRARAWQRASYEWSQRNEGRPTMEADITRDGTSVEWHGPPPPDLV